MKKFLPLFLLSGFFWITALVDSPLSQGIGTDREVFRYMGMALRMGQIPYLDVFDHKPPFIFLLAWLGDFGGIWGLWFLCNFITFLAAILLYRVSKSLGDAMAILPPLAFILLQKNPDIYEGGQLTRELSSAFILMVACLPFLPLRDLWKWMLAGLGTALVFLTQQNDILSLAPWIFYFAILDGSGNPNLKSGIRRSALFLGGFFAPLILVALWLASHNAFGAMIQVAFEYNFRHYIPEGSLISRMKGTFLHLINRNFLHRILMVLLPVFLLRGKMWTRPGFWGMLALALGCIGVSLSGNYFGHYFLPLMPWIAILFFLGLKEWQNQAGSLNAILTAGLFLGLVGDLILPFRYLSILKKSDDFSIPEWASPLETVRGKQGQFFSYLSPDYLALNVHYRILAPSFFLYQHLWEPRFQNWDKEGHEFGRILESLDRSNCRFILDESVSHKSLRPDIEAKWRDFVQSRYDTLDVIPEGKGFLLQRKEREP